MASTIKSSAALLCSRFGAKPPSSPTPVDSPCCLSTDLSAWYVSAPQRTASVKVGAPIGAIMNSWMSTFESACAPPLRMFIIGTGRTWAFGPPRYLKSCKPAESAAARATAIDTPMIAFAPSRDLPGVRSRSISAWSTSRWSSASWPSSSS